MAITTREAEPRSSVDPGLAELHAHERVDGRPRPEYASVMSERGPDDVELREVDADDLARDEIEPDPDELPGPVPDDDRELVVDDEGDLADVEGDLDA